MQSVVGNFGSLVLLTLPIGNPEDISLRALEILKSKDLFVSEDTRTFKRLLDYFSIDPSQKRIISFHDHSHEKKYKEIIEILKNHKDVYFVSEAGSPIVSDPAYPLVRYCLENNVGVDSIGGISSVISALELSGLRSQPFQFIGFLPRKDSQIKDIFKNLFQYRGTSIIFESPRRLEATLNLLIETKLNFKVSVIKEISKTFQNAYRYDHPSEIDFEEIDFRGEFVLVLEANNQEENNLDNEHLQLLAEKVLDNPGKKKDLAKLLGEILSRDSKEMYKELVGDKN